MAGLRLRMTALTALATVTLLGLAALGDGSLAGPRVSSWSGASAWYDEVGAGTVAVAGLRMVTMAAVAWLLLGTVLQLLASFTLRGGLATLADTISPLVLRRLAHGFAGLSVSAGLALPALPGQLGGDPPGTAVMQVVEEGAETSSTTVAPTMAPPAQVIVAPTATPNPAAPSLPADEEVRVEAGDSFWSLAVDVVSEGRSDAPGEAEVMRYWTRLIEANRERLVDPANPDLLFPNQVLVVPGIA